MTIRSKIILVFVPLIIAPLLLTAVAASLAARNGITGVATSFLRFKGEQLVNYANGQWRLLLDNNLAANPDFVGVAKTAVSSFATSLVRSDTELIAAVEKDGRLAMATAEVKTTDDERAALAALAASGAAGWNAVRLAGVDRVAEITSFEPFGWLILVSETRDTFYRSVNQILLQTAFILVLALSAALVLLIVFAAYLTRPLRAVADAMADIITSGELSRQVEVLYADETGRLGHTFNLMTRELEKADHLVKNFALQAVVARNNEKRVRTIFERYVPKDVIEQVASNPETALVGEDRVLAVLFSDIRQFTSISEKMLPDDVVKSLNRYFEMMVDIIMSHRGIVDKYIGDAIMAFYGAPVKYRDEAEMSVYSALDMVEALEDFHAWQREHGYEPWRIGIGINYGLVTVGNIGSDRKMNYTVVGDMVNLASRLEGLTKMYGLPIVISESVQRYVKDKVRCRLLDRVRVVGKTQASGIYTPGRHLTEEQETAWDLHDDGTRLYYSRAFAEAAIRFREVRRLLPQDVSARLFLEHCETNIATPPGPKWDGVIDIQEK
jgi:adenylate cyclase